jgi:DNA-binding CsgD family transcriptional regulator
MAGTKTITPKAATAIGADITHLHHLIRAILTATKVDDKTGDRPDADGNEHILVDTDLDGVRYLLIQMPATDLGRATLSPRELEIARMVAQGHQNKIIAGILNISTWTVCAHIRRIFAKLSVSSRAAMVSRLLETDRLRKSTVAGDVLSTRRRLTAYSAHDGLHQQRQDRRAIGHELNERRRLIP